MEGICFVNSKSKYSGKYRTYTGSNFSNAHCSDIKCLYKCSEWTLVINSKLNKFVNKFSVKGKCKNHCDKKINTQVNDILPIDVGVVQQLVLDKSQEKLNFNIEFDFSNSGNLEGTNSFTILTKDYSHYSFELFLNSELHNAQFLNKDINFTVKGYDIMKSIHNKIIELFKKNGSGNYNNYSSNYSNSFGNNFNSNSSYYINLSPGVNYFTTVFSNIQCSIAIEFCSKQGMKIDKSLLNFYLICNSDIVISKLYVEYYIPISIFTLNNNSSTSIGKFKVPMNVSYAPTTKNNGNFYGAYMGNYNQNFQNKNFQSPQNLSLCNFNNNNSNNNTYGKNRNISTPIVGQNVGLNTNLKNNKYDKMSDYHNPSKSPNYNYNNQTPKTHQTNQTTKKYNSNFSHNSEPFVNYNNFNNETKVYPQNFNSPYPNFFYGQYTPPVDSFCFYTPLPMNTLMTTNYSCNWHNFMTFTTPLIYENENVTIINFFKNFEKSSFFGIDCLFRTSDSKKVSKQTYYPSLSSLFIEFHKNDRIEKIKTQPITDLNSTLESSFFSYTSHASSEEGGFMIKNYINFQEENEVWNRELLFEKVQEIFKSDCDLNDLTIGEISSESYFSILWTEKNNVHPYAAFTSPSFLIFYKFKNCTKLSNSIHFTPVIGFISSKINDDIFWFSSNCSNNHGTINKTMNSTFNDSFILNNNKYYFNTFVNGAYKFVNSNKINDNIDYRNLSNY